MKVLAVRKVKEVQIQLDEVLDLERWEKYIRFTIIFKMR